MATIHIFVENQHRHVNWSFNSVLGSMCLSLCYSTVVSLLMWLNFYIEMYWSSSFAICFGCLDLSYFLTDFRIRGSPLTRKIKLAGFFRVTSCTRKYYYCNNTKPFDPRTWICPHIFWLSLISAVFYSLQSVRFLLPNLCPRMSFLI